MKATQILHDLGQSLWLDYITRDLLDSGALERYIDELSVTGLTSNPTIFDHAIKNGDGSADSGKHIAAKYSALRKEIVQVAAVAMAMLEDFDTQMRETGTVRFAK